MISKLFSIYEVKTQTTLFNFNLSDFYLMYYQGNNTVQQKLATLYINRHKCQILGEKQKTK